MAFWPTSHLTATPHPGADLELPPACTPQRRKVRRIKKRPSAVQIRSWAGHLEARRCSWRLLARICSLFRLSVRYPSEAGKLPGADTNLWVTKTLSANANVSRARSAQVRDDGTGQIGKQLRRLAWFFNTTPIGPLSRFLGFFHSPTGLLHLYPMASILG